MIEPVVNSLSALDPDGVSVYRQNGARYRARLDALHQWVVEQVEMLPEASRVLITAHDAFGYFGRAYGVEVVGLQGISTVADYGVNDVTRLVDLIVERKVKAIFVESSVPVRSIEAVREGCLDRGFQVEIGGNPILGCDGGRRQRCRHVCGHGRKQRQHHCGSLAMSVPHPIQIHDMTIAYHKKPVLWDVDLDVPEGQLVGVIGPNGSGKSTMIKAIMDLVPKASGWVKIYGEDYSQMRKIIGYVPQRESVDWDFPISALDVVLMGRYGHVGWMRRPSKEDRRLAWEALDEVGMAPFAERQISQLSGRPAAAGLSRPRLGPRGPYLHHGRAVCRRGCGDRACDHRQLSRPAPAGENHLGRASRLADRNRILRLGHYAQHAGRGVRLNPRGLYR